MKVHLLHTNDVHSQLENYLRLGARLRSLRQELVQRGEVVLTFDIGDLLDRVRPETEATLGRVNAALMAALRYDGWVFGNNEGLTVPVSEWPELARVADTTVFGTNLRRAGGEAFEHFMDTRIYERGGLRIGVFGVTPNYDLAYRALKVRALPPLHRAREAAKALREAGCDIVIALSHLGLREDRRLADSVPEIDVILGGHTHHFLPGAEWVGRTAIFQAGKHALVFGHTVIDYDPAARRVRDVVSETVPVPLDGPLDAAMLDAYRRYLPDIGARLEQTVVQLDDPLPVAFDEESLFANVLVEALFDAYPCDLGVMMAGALTASLLPGQVQLRHVLGACSTPTRPLLMTLAGKDITAIVEKSIQPEYYDRPGLGFGFRGAVVGWLSLANARVELDPAGPSGPRVRRMEIGGRPLEPDRLYRVVTCEYLWLAPVFREFQMGREIEVQAPLVREVLLERLGDAQLRERARCPRYVIWTGTDAQGENPSC